MEKRNPFDSLKEPRPTLSNRPHKITGLIYSIEIQIAIPMDRLKPFCEHFGCEVTKGVGDNVIITTTDPANFYWLGSNMNNGMLNDLINDSRGKFIAP